MAAPKPKAQPDSRRRGAPLGNNNARKQSVYARRTQVGRIETKDLAEIGSLTKEIFMLRTYYQAIFKITPKGLDYNAAIYTVRTLSQAAVAISRMYETNFELLRMRAEARAQMETNSPSGVPQTVQMQPAAPPPWAVTPADQPQGISKELEEKLIKISGIAKLSPGARDQFIRRMNAFNNTVKDSLAQQTCDDLPAGEDDQFSDDTPLGQ